MIQCVRISEIERKDLFEKMVIFVNKHWSHMAKYFFWKEGSFYKMSWKPDFPILSHWGCMRWNGPANSDFEWDENFYTITKEELSLWLIRSF